MRAELKRLHHDTGTTIIYVTHAQVEALTMSTTIALFRKGELVQVAPPLELYDNPVDLYTADFIGNPSINFVKGTATVTADGMVTKSDVGEWAFSRADMTPAAPEAHLTAAIWNWDVYYRTAIEAAMTCGPAENFVKQMGGASYYEGLESGFIDISPLSDNCVQGTEKAVQQVKDLIVSGKWDVFSGTKLRISKDGTITVIDDDLMDSRGSVILPAGSAPIDDEIITGKMNYFVEGVQLAH
jgi:ABC-type Fe3+/spermidine/putrescine transport system ATPase subunit